MMDNSQRKELIEDVKELIKTMNGLSEEGFRNRINSDPYFRKGFDVIVNVCLKAKEVERWTD